MSREFKLIGLNKPWKAGGFNSIYATVEKGREDGWFHCAFDGKEFSDERLNALFDMFKNTEENLWHSRNHRVVIESDSIKELILDNIKTPTHEHS